MSCMLDILPWDILHTIFDYLEIVDLLHGFVDVNPHLNTILHSYTRIQLNLKSVRKSTFHYICERIHPDQIQSLVLSDDEFTPGQIKLFMSLLPLIKFINLQYLNIHGIDHPDLLYLIFSHMENNTRISSLSITGSPIVISKKMSRSITDILNSLPFLKSLTIMNSALLNTLQQPLSRLTHLTISSCALNDLPIIFHWIPNLIYLHISVAFNNDLPTFDYVLLHLTTLIYESKSWVLFHQLEKFFSLTPSLKRLVLETMGDEALLDGKRWERLIQEKLSHLKKFSLNISPEENNLSADHVLASFHDQFWTNEKNWHMACLVSTMTDSCARLFSIPDGTPTEEWYPLGEGFTYHSLTPSSLYENFQELKIAYFPQSSLISSPLEQVQTLSLNCQTSEMDELEKIVNLRSVKHIKFATLVRYISFNDLLRAASNVNQITMSSQLFERMSNSFSTNDDVYEQITKLTINDITSPMDIATFSRMFPKLEHLSLSVKQRDDALAIFNEFHHLISATVHWTHPSKTSVDIIEKHLQENDVCSDGAYRFHSSTLNVWID